MKTTFRVASVPVLVMGTAIEAKGEACRRFGGGEIAQGRACAVWAKVGAPLASYGPRAAIDCVTSAQLLARDPQDLLLTPETTQLHSGGLWVDSEAAKSLKVAPAQSGSKSMRRSSPRDLYARYRR